MSPARERPHENGRQDHVTGSPRSAPIRRLVALASLVLVLTVAATSRLRPGAFDGLDASVDDAASAVVGASNTLIGDGLRWLTAVQEQILDLAGQAEERTLVLVLSLAVSCLAAMAVAATVLFQRRDVRFRTVADVVRASGHPCIGTLPEIPDRNPHREREQFAEAIWDLAVRLALVGGSQSRVVMIASPNASEGKSVLAIGLAKCLSEIGQEVLLVNATPHGGEDAVEPDKATLDGMLDAEAATHLLPDVVQPGRMVARPSKSGYDRRILGPAFPTLLEDARKRYNTVLIEAPPTSLFPDALILGRNADVVLVVARARSTRRSALTDCLARLGALPVRVAGVVLSRTAGRVGPCSPPKPAPTYEPGGQAVVRVG